MYTPADTLSIPQPIPPSRGRPSHSLHYAVGEISGKLDQVIAHLLPRLTDIEASHAALEIRVGNNEKVLARFMGGGAVVVFLITAFEVIRYAIHYL